MIDVFLRTNTLIADIHKALGGLDCNHVQVRNCGQPTEMWQRAGDGWKCASSPAVTLYEDLLPDYLSFSAFRSEAGGAGTHFVDEVMGLLLSCDEARGWLAEMVPHQYEIEDAIGFTHRVDGVVNACAVALLSMSDFKAMTQPSNPLAQKILEWVDRAQTAGADQIGVTIALGRHP
ncbi:MAG: hypothetical protein K8I30_08205 [Anaerolineae bacterium]|nr:hypothetical protein [Anaerolineae bacterium]